MELLVSLGVLIVFAALAALFSADSRDSLKSHEFELAALGYIREQPERWTR